MRVLISFCVSWLCLYFIFLQVYSYCRSQVPLTTDWGRNTPQVRWCKQDYLHFWECILRIPKHQYKKMYALLCSQQCYLQSQDLETTWEPISRWMDKKAVIHLLHEMLHSSKKEVTLTFCDSMDGPREHYAKWNKAVSEGQISYDLTYMWNLMHLGHWLV